MPLKEISLEALELLADGFYGKFSEDLATLGF